MQERVDRPGESWEKKTWRAQFWSPFWHLHCGKSVEAFMSSWSWFGWNLELGRPIFARWLFLSLFFSRRRGAVGIAALLCRWQTAGGGSIPCWSASKTQDRRPAERQRARKKKLAFSFVLRTKNGSLLVIHGRPTWRDRFSNLNQAPFPGPWNHAEVKATSQIAPRVVQKAPLLIRSGKYLICLCEGVVLRQCDWIIRMSVVWR